MKDLNIAIIGAGIGGLSAALALQKLGFRATVFEQAPQLGEVGAGLSLSPTAVHGLNWLGMREVLESKAYKPEDQCVRHYQDGRAISWINRGQSLLDRYGERYYLIHRADLHDGLAARVRANDPARSSSTSAVRRSRRTPTASRSPSPTAPPPGWTCWSAPTARVRRCATPCSARSSRSTPATSPGAA